MISPNEIAETLNTPLVVLALLKTAVTSGIETTVEYMSILGAIDLVNLTMVVFQMFPTCFVSISFQSHI